MTPERGTISFSRHKDDNYTISYKNFGHLEFHFSFLISVILMIEKKRCAGHTIIFGRIRIKANFRKNFEIKFLPSIFS